MSEDKIISCLAHNGKVNIRCIKSTNMVEELFASTSPNFTPDGKAILSILPNERLGQPFL